MSLTKNNTKWVLFLSSSEPNAEHRHVMDLVFGLVCLEKAGVEPSSIHIYVDGRDRSRISNLFLMGSTNSYNVKTSSDFFADMQDCQYEHLVMFVTGHGSEQGIDAPTPITPHSLLQTMKSSQKLDKAIVYFGQCYAGIFNYVKAGRGRSNPQDEHQETDVIFIGATELQESLSSSTSEVFPVVGSEVSWQANLFLLYVFKWISEPFDVDGDTNNTIMDSFKYAGVMTNRSHKQIKAGEFINLMDAFVALKQAQHNVNNPTGDVAIDMNNKLTLQAIEQKYMNSSYINNVHQECWILNSIPAQYVDI